MRILDRNLETIFGVNISSLNSLCLVRIGSGPAIQNVYQVVHHRGKGFGSSRRVVFRKARRLKGFVMLRFTKVHNHTPQVITVLTYLIESFDCGFAALSVLGVRSIFRRTWRTTFILADGD